MEWRRSERGKEISAISKVMLWCIVATYHVSVDSVGAELEKDLRRAEEAAMRNVLLEVQKRQISSVPARPGAGKRESKGGEGGDR